MPEEQTNIYKGVDNLPSELWEDAAARPPVQAAEVTGANWDGSEFLLPMVGRQYKINVRQRRLWQADDSQKPVSYQTGLVLLHTLAFSKGVPPAGRLATPQEMPGGAMFFVGPHAINTPELCLRFGRDPGSLLEQARALGGCASQGADAAVMMPGLPQVPLYALVWAEDDEFPARAVLGLDAHAHYHLALDAMWALTNLCILRLVGKPDA